MNPTYTMAQAPGALPVLGHAAAFARRPLDFIRELPDHGDLVRVRLGPLTAHVVCHPDLLHRVLAEDRVFDKGGPVFETFRKTAGNGLLGCPARDHRRQRRLVQPAFHRSRLPGYSAAMAEEIAALTEPWRPGQTLDVPALMYRLTTAVTTRCLFASAAQAADLPSLHESVDIVTQGIARRAMLPVPALHRLPTPANRRYQRTQRYLRHLTDTLIDSYRTQGTDQGDLLSMLLAPQDDGGPGLTGTEIHDQILTFQIGRAHV